MNAGNYDGRTALHLAAAEGHLASVRYQFRTTARMRLNSITATSNCRHNYFNQDDKGLVKNKYLVHLYLCKSKTLQMPILGVIYKLLCLDILSKGMNIFSVIVSTSDNIKRLHVVAKEH